MLRQLPLARGLGGQQTECVVFGFRFYVNNSLRTLAVQIVLPDRTQFLQQTSRLLEECHSVPHHWHRMMFTE